MNGIILIDKPQGWTSHDIVAKLRGILHERRIGHSGTLDPLATGLLVVFVGRATRAVEFAEADSKEYIAGLRLGLSTDTQDISGNVISKCSDLPDEEAVYIEAVNGFVGDIETDSSQCIRQSRSAAKSCMSLRAKVKALSAPPEKLQSRRSRSSAEKAAIIH